MKLLKNATLEEIQKLLGIEEEQALAVQDSVTWSQLSERLGSRGFHHIDEIYVNRNQLNLKEVGFLDTGYMYASNILTINHEWYVVNLSDFCLALDAFTTQELFNEYLIQIGEN